MSVAVRLVQKCAPSQSAVDCVRFPSSNKSFAVFPGLYFDCCGSKWINHGKTNFNEQLQRLTLDIEKT